MGNQARKLKLQMQISLDGYVTAEYGGTNFNWDNELRMFCIENLTDIDCILIERKTAEDLIPYLADAADKPDDPDCELGKRITEIPKAVFSNSLKESKWDNAAIVSGDLVTEIKKQKDKNGKNLIVYGGFSFASSLIKEKLIDEFNLLLNPVAVGSGESIFSELKNNLLLTLQDSKTFESGTVLLSYINRI